MTEKWVVTLMLMSDKASSAHELRSLRNALPRTSVGFELHSTSSGTRITIIGDETTVTTKVLPFLCDDCSSFSGSSSWPGDTKRTLKKRHDQECTHLGPGEDATVGRSKFKIAHCKLAAVPEVPSLQARHRDGGQVDEINRWLIDQLMKIALSPNWYAAGPAVS